MAITIMGGLFVATFLTLLFLPSLYALWYRKRLDERGGEVGKVAPATERAQRPRSRLRSPPNERQEEELAMTDVMDHTETDVRERILVTAERLFREIGYQKTTVADIAKALRMSPANVYRFFDSKKSINAGVARRLMGEVEQASQVIAASADARPSGCASY